MFKTYLLAVYTKMIWCEKFEIF